MPFELPALPYDVSALEPHIAGRTMQVHHGKHHAAYVAKLNAALEGHPDLASRSIEALLRDIDAVPEKIRQTVIDNGGGHANHSLFWRILAPGRGGPPGGDLADDIHATFGGFGNFKNAFTDAALKRFGSGWAWLVVDADRALRIISTPNQDSPYMHGVTPILGLDLWEHAYYLTYHNRRADYVDAWWNVVDWESAAELHYASRGLAGEPIDQWR